MSETKFDDAEMLARCEPMSRVQAALGSKWKLLILWYVACYRVQRFGQLLRRLDGVTQSSLTRQLRELERDGFLRRQVYPEVPPRVEYSLSELGQSFVPILTEMVLWSERRLCPPDYVRSFHDLPEEAENGQTRLRHVEEGGAPTPGPPRSSRG